MIGAVLDELPFDVAADQRVRAFIRERLPPVLSAQERDAMVGGAYYASKLLKPKKGASALDAENAPKVAPGARVRFVRADCVRLLFEGGMAVLYHAMDNRRGYKQHDEQVCVRARCESKC
jgi:hypothetical protein